jgi:hypothetical protein
MTGRQREGDHDPVSNVIYLFRIIQTRRTITMISRADAHRAAIHLIDALGPEAANAAHERTSEMLTLGDAGRYEIWSMILDAIEGHCQLGTDCDSFAQHSDRAESQKRTNRYRE